MSEYNMEDIDFKDGLVRVVVVDNESNEVLNLGNMDRDALRKTIETGLVHYYSVSKGRIRMKGETSGNVQKLRKIMKNCENDSLLIRVVQTGPACHTGHYSCFYRKVGESDIQDSGINYSLAVLRDLETIISQRKEERPEGSYTTSLFEKGIEEIYKKFGEEAVEVLLAKGKERIVYESADMLYHFLVLLSLNDIKLDDIMAELASRRAKEKSED